MCLCFKTNQLIRIPTRKNNYLYDALGQKVRKVITDNPQITTTDYQGIFHYENEVLKFFATTEGYVNVLTKGNKTAYNYVYNYTDHLGNIRLSYTESPEGEVEVLEENHYYPFGLKHKKYGSTVKDLVEVEDGEDYYVGIEIVPPGARKTYQYKYNGKEFQDELGLNFYDYGARNYDPALGRWMNIDPLAEDYYFWSSYVYTLNNPVRFVDPDGKSTYVVLNPNGTYRVVGGNLDDDDRNIYLFSFKDGKFTGTKSIGESATMYSFYNADKDKNGKEYGWMGTIDPNDNSGKQFLDNLVIEDPSLGDYTENATKGLKYDFKRTNGTDSSIYNNTEDFYRGMPVQTNEDGTKVYGSARDVGNIGAGYVAGRLYLSWERSRQEFDKLESKQKGRPSIETIGTQQAQYLGWQTGIRDARKGVGALPYRWIRALPKVFKN